MSRPPEIGLRANWRQFWLLVLVNAFVGGMVGLERVVLPLLAESGFGIASRSAALSFIATFGLVKALSNLAAGHLGDRLGRKHVLVAGWLIGLPVPFLLIAAPAWSWVIAANVLLGINQGLTWSTTVIMKIDLVGPTRRGLAMGLNEFAGYLAVALAALASGYVAEAHGLRPAPFYLGIAFAAAGLALSTLFVRETHGHAREEARLTAGESAARNSAAARGPAVDAGEGHAADARSVFALTSWRNPTLSSASQAGLVNNLNDGLAWGLFPLFLAAGGLSVGEIGVIGFIYPAVWGLLQLATGAWSDRVGRKLPIVLGMTLQGLALIAFAMIRGFGAWAAAAALLGAGTALVYPTLLAAVGDVAHPSWRGSAVGVYRLWRDAGYVVGALLAGSIADLFGMPQAIVAVGLLTLASGGIVAWRMPGTSPR